MNIKYVSSAKSPSGYGCAARVDVVSLFCAGVNLTCENLMQMAETTDYGLPGAIASSLENRNLEYKIIVIHLTPDMYPQFMEKGKYHIGRLFWEMDRLPKEWVEPCNQMDELWVASPQMAEMIQRSGVTTLCTPFPQPIETNKAKEHIESFVLPIQKDFVFYSIGQWIDRKNFRGLLRAYWKAFEGEDKVSLLIKTYRVNYSEAEYALLKKELESYKRELNLRHFPKVLLARHLLNEEQISKLHKLGDCYVSPSSGEGWNRPMQEAMLFGKPVISADNGGITDIMTDQYYFKVPSKLHPATEQSHIPWYTKDQKWKIIDEDQLGEQMKFIFNNYDKGLERAKKAQEYVVDNFNFLKVGLQMKDRLEKVL